MRIVQLENWNQIHAHDVRQWVWRGQRRASRNIKSSLERLFERREIPPEKRIYVESELLREFKRNFHHWGTSVPADDRSIEWLALMQHYGAPTRLTDFSYSIYVAAYFALEQASDECAVFGIDSFWAANATNEVFERNGENRLHSVISITVPETETEAGGRIFREPCFRYVVPLNPFRLNDRLRIQKGIFLIPGDPCCTFMENLAAMPGYEEDRHVLKIVIPKELRFEAIEKLHYMNISRTSLFPGLDGYAQSLGVFHPCLSGSAQVPRDRS